MPVFPECCVENVSNLGGELCSWDMCKRIQDRLNNYCKASGQNPCAAVPQEEYGKECYCCCSCYAYDTPIEASPGEFMLVQDIVAACDSVLAGSYVEGQAPEWVERIVDYSDGIGPAAGEEPLEFDFMHYLTYQSDDGKTPAQFVITTVDHLFLLPNGKVTPVQYLKPGDKLVNAHGGLSTVRFVVVAAYSGGLHHLFFNDFNNKTLDNHLLSANGIVCADYSVQLRYSDGSLNPELVDIPKQEARLRVSEPEYQARFSCKEAVDFVNDETLWPVGLTPRLVASMVNIPRIANRFVTNAQAADIQENLDLLPPDNTTNLKTARWLFDVYGAFYSDIVYLIDWDNESPNAYTWVSTGQRIILLTGGLLRVPKLIQDGLALILAHMVAVSKGAKCVGPADYQGVFYELREVWINGLYHPTFRAGLSQVRIMFDAVDPKNAGPNPKDICRQPSLACRVTTMEEAAGMGPLPPCADPDQFFGVVKAAASTNRRRVVVTFNRELNIETAQTTDNYAIKGANDDELEIRSAEVSAEQKDAVRLGVSKMAGRQEYTVTVTNVLSADETPIDPERNQATFRSR